MPHTPSEPRHTIDYERFVPKYARLEADLRARIASGDLAPGAPIPSESVLARHAGASRVTVRQALSRLRFEGLLESAPGRGTFVARPRVIHPGDSIRPFEEKMAAQGVVVDHKLLAFDVVEATPEIKEWLDLHGVRAVYRVERLRIVHGREVGLERHFIPVEVGKRLSRDLLGTAPILRLVEEAQGVTAQRMRIGMKCATAAPGEARQLRIRRGAPVLIRDHVFLTGAGKPIMAGRNVFTSAYQSLLELEEVNGQVIAHQWRQTLSDERR